MKKVTMLCLCCFIVFAWFIEVRAYFFVLTNESYSCEAIATCGHIGDGQDSGTLSAMALAMDTYTWVSDG
jgi:hypothetical protein